MNNKIIEWLKKNKYKAIVTVLVIVIVMAWNGRKVKKPEEVQKPNIETEELGINLLENKLEKIIWPKNGTDISEKYNLIDNKTGKIGTVELLKIAEWMGSTNMAKIIDENGLLSYKDENKGDMIYVNMDNNSVHFNRGYIGDDYYQKVINENDIVEAKKDFEKLINNLSTWIEGGTIRLSDIDYQKIDGPRAVTALKKEANIINLTADIIHEEKVLYASYGVPILTARYGSGGILLEFRMENPRLKLSSGEERKSVKWEEIKKVSLDQVKVLVINGTNEFEMSQQDDVLTEINISDINIRYLYSPKNNYFVPFLIGEGSSQLKSGPAIIKIGVILIK